MQLGCTARRVSFRILLDRAAAESLCAAEGLRARMGRRPGGGIVGRGSNNFEKPNDDPGGVQELMVPGGRGGVYS